MSQVALPEVFTAAELAQAAGVPLDAVHALVTAGDIRPMPGTRFIAAADAVRAGRRLRSSSVLTLAAQDLTPPDLFALSNRPVAMGRERTRPAFVSSGVHALLLILALGLTTGTETAAVDEVPREPSRLVFIVSPGPGGGGGGGGLRNPLPAPKVQRRGLPRPRISVPAVSPKPVVTEARRAPEPVVPAPVPPPVPKPAERPPELLPSKVVVAPVVAAAVDTRDREGVIEKGRGEAESQGSGDRGGSGAGQGTGNGEGLGAGIGDGSGGGTGGGPFRPGSGIDPPRLLREVKADYTDEARRRNLTGDVVLEIVVRSDGSVGDVKILQGLGSGLDQRAVVAVRQWRFSPARRKGVAVDVVVEVAVEFSLR